MRSRAIIRVIGQQDAGKTAFIEALVREIGVPVLVARCVRDDTLRESQETRPRFHRELRRYRAAGASGVALFAFPGSNVDSDAFFMTHLMEEYSNAVVLEGDNPIGAADLSVYVASAPARGQRLLARRAAGPSERTKAKALKRLLRQPEGIEELLEGMFGPPMADLARQHPGLLQDMRMKMLDEFESTHEALSQKAPQHWTVASPLRGIEHAQLVVVNVRGETERARAERLVAEV